MKASDGTKLGEMVAKGLQEGISEALKNKFKCNCGSDQFRTIMIHHGAGFKRLICTNKSCERIFEVKELKRPDNFKVSEAEVERLRKHLKL